MSGVGDPAELAPAAFSYVYSTDSGVDSAWGFFMGSSSDGASTSSSSSAAFPVAKKATVTLASAMAAHASGLLATTALVVVLGALGASIGAHLEVSILGLGAHLGLAVGSRITERHSR